MTPTSNAACASAAGTWPTTRILFALAGSVTVLGSLLAAAISAWFLLLTAFAGLNQLLYVATGACPVSLVLERLRPLGAPGMIDAHHLEEI